MRLIAVTACPTGIAHTYMAAEALEQAAKAAGHEIVVETQGSAGSTPFTDEQLASADAVILAADVAVRGRERFEHLPTVEGGVKQAINHAPEMIGEAQAAAEAHAATPAAERPVGPPAGSSSAKEAGFGSLLRQWLMTGVSYMIPFVAAGGLLIAIAFLIGGPEIATKVNGGVFDGQTYQAIDDLTKLWGDVGIAGVLFKIGDTAFTMLVPILAGYIAYGMADRPGLVPGIVGGLIATSIDAGFLGGIVAGLLAGGVVLAINRVPVHKNVRGIMPVVVVPLVATTIVGLLMIAVVGPPVADVMDAVTDWLKGLGGSNAILLGALLGAMMAFDMGGPINKVAYTFGVASIAANPDIMAAVIVAGMTPPLGIALATVVRKRLFTEDEREAGKANWLLGASFITEGAIPFAAADPLRVIPSLIAGSAVGGALSMGFGASSPAPHGGLWIVPLIGDPVLWVVAIAAGTAVTCACLVAVKSLGRRPVVAETTPGAPATGVVPSTVNA
ncbi:MAG: PTS fructose transporter subunit IIBC [Patulibacter sp.]